MRIALAYRQESRGDRAIECYPRSFHRVLKEKGHKVTNCGEGHEVPFLGELDQKKFDAVIEIENGRNAEGKLVFQQNEANWTIPSVLWAIDVHGNPHLHKHVSVCYNHVFFAPWVKRDVYVDHPSAHWCPNSTDLKWFDKNLFKDITPQYDFGFHSSKLGLARAAKLVEICEKRKWSCDVRQVSKAGKHKWPAFGQAIAACNVGYNWGQRADGPNQRVMETIASGIPLLNDLTLLDGMAKLFVEGKHFIGYQRDWSDLEEKMEWMIMNTSKCKEIAETAYLEVKEKHTIENRVNQILEVLEK